MTQLDLSRYGPAFAALLSTRRLNLLDAGRPDKDYRPQLEALANPTAFAPHKVRDAQLADACRAGLWLYHDFLDEAHNISQDLHTPEGSYWHALVHRREPDYDNAKYWFRRVGAHPIFPALREAIVNLAKGRMWPTLLAAPTWQPELFVDLCAAHADPAALAYDFCRKIQQCEWELLFDYCYRGAVGA